MAVLKNGLFHFLGLDAMLPDVLDVVLVPFRLQPPELHRSSLPRRLPHAAHLRPLRPRICVSRSLAYVAVTGRGQRMRASGPRDRKVRPAVTHR
jgi:hypothetical protein